MRIDWDAPIEADDGLVLRADVFRPDDDGEHPVILTYGPYAKGLSFQEGYPDQWRILAEEHPEVERGSSCRYQNWEVVDPERWVPDGYVCVRVDSRGTGQSPGFIDPFSARERHDFYECIEWAGTRPWSNGRVGLLGVSYYGINQWHVAADQPPHLAAICPWEGAADWYRDMTHHGGILSSFWANWYDKQVKVVQHGLGEAGPRNPVTGELAAGAQTLSEQELAEGRTDFGEEIRSHPLDDDYHRERSADWSKVEVPMLSAANWGGQGLHPRGNFEAYANAASEQKWLEIHGLEHWTEFYTDYGIEIQKRFFGHFLKGEEAGWEKQPPVQLLARRVDGSFEQRSEDAWPIPRTEWTELYLGPAEMTLAEEPPAEAAEAAYEAMGDGLTFLAGPAESETELTGPLAARLFVSSSTEDADLFLVARLFDPEGEEAVFTGALDPHTPLAQGWLRASHRELDPERSLPWRPFHTHSSLQPLAPGEVYELEVELWPTSVIVPPGHRLGLTVRGRDYEYPGEGASLGSFKNVMKGCGPFLHDDPHDRPAETFGGSVTVHAGPERRSRLLVPVIPREG
ncbi:MAG: CocE/NonD family hydrolase [Solirubrobacterales bacterium]|nr:CocE/NonD family hydrolase [Solirubrobacterales bacterium]